MILSPRLPIVVGIFLLVSVAACDDPSGVGLDLIDEEGGIPSTAAHTLELSTFNEPAISGGTANVLVGQYSDPVLNQEIRTNGHINFFPPDSDDFEEDDEIEGASLQLNPTVAHGDTAGTIRVALRTITDEWQAINTTSDTTLQVSEVIDEYDIDVGSAQAQLDLPDEWVEEYREVLRDTALVDQFYGFQIETISGNSILSIPGQSTILTLRSTGDSDVALTATPEFSLTTAEATEPTLVDRKVLQHVSGYAARTVVPVADSLVNHSVNRAAIEVPVDTTTLRMDESIARQEPENLFAELSTETNSTFIRLTRSPGNPEMFTSEQDAATVRQFFQQTLREAETVDSATIKVFPNQHFPTIVPEGAVPDIFELRLSTIPLYPADARDCPYTRCSPRLLLTTTPLD